MDIVIAYLRLHEYLPINWNQHFKVSRIPNRNSHQRNENWPGIDVDYRIFSFEKWMAKKPSSPLIHPARFKYNVWKNCSDGIKIFNIQDSKINNKRGIEVDGYLLTNFSCKAIKGAKNTCSGVLINLNKNGTDKGSTDNTSVNLNYDILAVYAYENCFVANNSSRPELAGEIKRFVSSYEGGLVNFPMKCTNSTILDYIYNSYLKNELWALSVIERQDAKLNNIEDWYVIKPLAAEQQNNFDNIWRHSLDGNKFCVVDVKDVMKQDEWKKFLLV